MKRYVYTVVVSHNSVAHGNLRVGDRLVLTEPGRAQFLRLVAVEEVEDVKGPAKSGKRGGNRAKSGGPARSESGERDEGRSEANGPEVSGTPVGEPEA